MYIYRRHQTVININVSTVASFLRLPLCRSHSLRLRRTTSSWTSSTTSRATWRRGCRVTRLEAPPSPAKMAWRARAAPAEARSTTPLYRMPVPQHTCSLWHTHTHTNNACRSSAPSTSSPSAPGELRISKEDGKKNSNVPQLVCYGVIVPSHVYRDAGMALVQSLTLLSFGKLCFLLVAVACIRAGSAKS